MQIPRFQGTVLLPCRGGLVRCAFSAGGLNAQANRRQDPDAVINELGVPSTMVDSTPTGAERA